MICGVDQHSVSRVLWLGQPHRNCRTSAAEKGQRRPKERGMQRVCVCVCVKGAGRDGKEDRKGQQRQERRREVARQLQPAGPHRSNVGGVWVIAVDATGDKDGHLGAFDMEGVEGGRLAGSWVAKPVTSTAKRDASAGSCRARL